MKQPDFRKLNSQTAKETYQRVYEKYVLPFGKDSESAIKETSFSPNTKNLYLNALSWIIDELGLKWPKPKLIRARVLTDKMPLSARQIDQVRHEFDFKSDLFRKTFELLIMTGMRAEEITLINPEEINHEKGIFFVRGAKGNKDRFIPIPKGFNLNEKFLEDFKTIGYQPLYREIKKIGEFLEQPCSPHSLRYTFATTRMYENDVKLEVIQELMGHSTIEQTLGYIKFSTKNMIIEFNKQFLDDLEVIKNKDWEYQAQHYKRLYSELLLKMEGLKNAK